MIKTREKQPLFVNDCFSFNYWLTNDHNMMNSEFLWFCRFWIICITGQRRHRTRCVRSLLLDVLNVEHTKGVQRGLLGRGSGEEKVIWVSKNFISFSCHCFVAKLDKLEWWGNAKEIRSSALKMPGLGSWLPSNIKYYERQI